MECLEQLAPLAQWEPQDHLENVEQLAKEDQKEAEACPEHLVHLEPLGKLDQLEILACLENLESLEGL